MIIDRLSKYCKWLIKKTKRKSKPIYQRYMDQYLKDIKGVIRVGANTGQERFLYSKYNLKVLWFEAETNIEKVIINNYHKHATQLSIL